jgi:hypothetical protein
MQFTIGGAPVRDRGLRMWVGGILVAMITVCVVCLASVDQSGYGRSGSARIMSGIVAGIFVAIGGAWKDAPKEGFDPIKFCRSPAITLCSTLLLCFLTDSLLQATVASIGFERATSETYKTFFFPARPRGKFAGKPVLFPDILVRRKVLVPVFVAIWIVVLSAGALAMTDAARATKTVLTQGDRP